MKRSDVVIVDFRSLNPALGIRPAIVIQNDRDNARMSNTVVVQVTTNLRRNLEDTQLLIDQSHSDWALSGLRHPSVINCSNIYTVRQSHIAKVIGRLSQGTMIELWKCIQRAVGQP